MGHYRSVRSARRAMSRARCRHVHCTQCSAPQPNLRVHAIYLVLHLRHRIALVLPQFTSKLLLMYLKIINVTRVRKLKDFVTQFMANFVSLYVVFLYLFAIQI